MASFGLTVVVVVVGVVVVGPLRAHNRCCPCGLVLVLVGSLWAHNDC